ncbi:hypothetical protein HXX76_012219 [Chlamydomonas incerta]|uniref:Uncharacterized protein n=1 Tax=Chlamydomonas incerta TaxID=51695 RepID=A0A835SW05_CHLIN|nr:hypothetical protein HXX76_012219 [Chlamydomonas incerta]|eukprot:KAG2427565.1 hypothetical protein HXX76_012219 [Chlamydomonas incerta]
MDEAEQDALIREFEAISASSRRMWQLVWGLVALGGAAFYGWSAWRQHVEPWGVRYTGVFRPVVDSAEAVVAVLASQAVAMVLAAAALLSNVPPKGHRDVGCMPVASRQLLLGLTGAAVGCAGAAFWAAGMWRLAQRFGWEDGVHLEALWLPTLPVTCCLLCTYVASSLGDTEKQVQKLKDMRYRFKKA